MTLNSVAKSHVRTVVPVIVGLLVSLALRAGYDLHGYTPEITAAVTYLYYAVVRLAEEHLSPQFGWMLGVAAKPHYTKPS